MRASDFLTSAANLVPSGPGRPLETDLRRAVSTVYYAVFHGMAECCADELFNRNRRGRPGWVRIYRALNHGRAREACLGSEVRSFPVQIRDFASLFIALQDMRHMADYDPTAEFHKSEVVRLIDTAQDVLRDFERAGRLERRHFASVVLFRKRN